MFDRWGNQVFYCSGSLLSLGLRTIEARVTGETVQGDRFLGDGMYNWLLSLTLVGDTPDMEWPKSFQCDGPRQFCGTVNVLR